MGFKASMVSPKRQLDIPSGYVNSLLLNMAIEIVSFSIKNGDFPTKNGDCPIKNCDFHIKNGDFP